MKTMMLATLLALSTTLSAQVGAKVDSITYPKIAGGAVLHHCEAVAELPEGIKVAHDDGVSVVPVQFLPEQWQKAVQEKQDAEAAAYKKNVAQREEEERKSEELAAVQGKSASLADTEEFEEGGAAVESDPNESEEGEQGIRIGSRPRSSIGGHHHPVGHSIPVNGRVVHSTFPRYGLVLSPWGWAWVRIYGLQ